MDQKAMVVMNYRQLALVFEQSQKVAKDDSVHISQRQEAGELANICADLMGRDKVNVDPEA